MESAQQQAMTDPLIEIAESLESQAVLAEVLGVDHRHHGVEPHEIKILAARVRAFWTPQRRAFYEAAIMYAAAVGALRYEPIAESRAFHDAYHALVESERGESEGE